MKTACRNISFSHCYLGGGPLPRPRPGPAPGPGPGALGPGGLLTGPRALGLDDARATSFCRLTPLPAVPGFVFVGFGFGSCSGGFSVQRERNGYCPRCSLIRVMLWKSTRSSGCSSDQALVEQGEWGIGSVEGPPGLSWPGWWCLHCSFDSSLHREPGLKNRVRHNSFGGSIRCTRYIAKPGLRVWYDINKKSLGIPAGLFIEQNFMCPEVKMNVSTKHHDHYHLLWYDILTCVWHFC